MIHVDSWLVSPISSKEGIRASSRLYSRKGGLLPCFYVLSFPFFILSFVIYAVHISDFLCLLVTRLFIFIYLFVSLFPLSSLPVCHYFVLYLVFFIFLLFLHCGTLQYDIVCSLSTVLQFE